MKKIIVLVAFVFFLNSFCLAASNDDNFNNEKQVVDSNVVEEIENHNIERAKEFKLQKQDDGKVEQIITPMWTYPVSKVLASFPTYQQQTSYYCGPASIQMMIGFNGKSVAQSTLASQAGTTASGSNTLALRNVLNQHVGTTHNYGVIRIGSSGYTNLFNIINSNIFTKNQPVLSLVRTNMLPYYNGHTTNHYIVVKGMTKYIDDGTGQPIISSSQINVVDPNNNNNFFGNFTVNYNSFFDAVNYDWVQAYNISY